ncbi:MAG: glycosyltransferase family 4 protein [bacterium]
MKIALFDNLPPGGAKRAMRDFASGLNRLGHNIDLFTLSTAALDCLPIDEFIKNKKVYDFTPGKHSFFYIENAFIKMRDLDRLDALCRKIAADISAGGYDLAFVHHCRIARTPLVLRYLNIPSVYYCQEPSRRHYEPLLQEERWPDDGLKSTVRNAVWNLYFDKQKKLEELAAQKADLLLVNSLYSQKAIKKAYGIEGRVCYLSVDSGKFKPLGIKRENIILTVGRLDPKKGHSFLIESLSKVKNIKDYSFVIVADSEDSDAAARLKKLAIEKRVQLEIKVGVDEQKLLELYNSATLVVYAPVMEPFGLVPLEAAACGTTTVGIAEGGVVETIVDGETGLLARRDPAEFAASVMRLLESPELRDRLGARARENAAKKWNPAHSVEALLSYFEKAIVFYRDKTL